MAIRGSALVRLLVGVVCSVAWPVMSSAQTHCVSTESGLRQRLQEWAAGNVAKEIRLVQGTYTLTQDALAQFTNSDKSLSLLGGYAAGCGSRVLNSSNTTVVGSDSWRLNIVTGGEAPVLVEGIRWSGLLHLRVGSYGSVSFRLNEVLSSAGFLLGAQAEISGKVVSVTNNLVGQGHGSESGVGLTSVCSLRVAGTDSGSSLSVSRNTITGNSIGSAPSNAGALCIGAKGGATVISNVIWNNLPRDVYVLVDNPPIDFNPAVFVDNIYSSLAGQPPASGSSGTLNADPDFVNPGAGDYHLTEPGSPAINSGIIPGPFGGLAQDLDGGPRLVGSREDRGAYESTVNNVTEIFVNNTGDAGAGSLRQAILDANASGGFRRIRFNLACPSTIELDSALPDLTTDMDIDGYSNPGAVPNTTSLGWNGRICVGVIDFFDTPALSYALRVANSAAASVNVTLRGLAFGGFSSSAVQLRGGSAHVVQGNQFGGSVPGGLGPLPTNGTHLVVTENATDAVIGGPQPEDRNVFDEATLNGIVLSGTTSDNLVEGNHVGVDPYGTGAAGNGASGILISSTLNTIRSNLISANVGSGVTLSGVGATDNVLAFNTIGLDVLGNGGAAMGNDVGVALSGSASSNSVGVSNRFGNQPNLIANNERPGVWVTPTGGVGNSIRGNRIRGNGTSGTGLGIDLDALGVTVNDFGDLDTGPNNIQNTPSITSQTQMGGGASTLAVFLSSSGNDSFVVDVYRSATCPNDGLRGDGDLLVGSGPLSTNSSGTGTANLSLAAGIPGFLTASATRSNGDTSELSACFQETDLIFADGFD